MRVNNHSHNIALGLHSVKLFFQAVYIPIIHLLSMDFKKVLRHLGEGTLKPVIDRVLPMDLEEVRGAHETLEKGDQFGKIVFKTGE